MSDESVPRPAVTTPIPLMDSDAASPNATDVLGRAAGALVGETAMSPVQRLIARVDEAVAAVRGLSGVPERTRESVTEALYAAARQAAAGTPVALDAARLSGLVVEAGGPREPEHPFFVAVERCQRAATRLARERNVTV